MELSDVTYWFLIISNLFVAVTFPLHILLVYVLIKKRKTKSLGTPYHHLLLSIGISDVVTATGYLTLQEPAWLGISSHFFITNGWWIAKIVNFCCIGVSNVPMIIHFIIALNRLTAVRFPIQHNSIWQSPTVPWISVVVWGLVMMICLPLFFVQFVAYEVEDTKYSSVAFRFVNPFPSMFYTSYVLLLSILIIPTILIYFYLLAYIGFVKFVRKTKNPIKRIVAKNTVAVFCTSFGDIVLVLVIGSQQLWWMLYKEDLMPVPLYWMLFKLGHDLHNIATPWVMLIFFSGLRRDFRKAVSGVLLSRSTNSASKV